MNFSNFHLGIFSDNAKNSKTLETFLSTKQIQIHWFENPNSILDFIKTHPLDLLILESQSEHDNTNHLCSEIRKESNLPVVVVTYTAKIQQIIEAVNAGIDYIVPGPIDESWLSTFLEKFFEVVIDKKTNKIGGYQFNYDKYKLAIEQKRAASLLISLAEGYIRNKDLVNSYIGSIAHDIRNPLSVILNYTQLFLELSADKMSDEEKKMLQAIDRSSKHILKILEELLDISSLDSAKMKLDISDVLIQEIVENCYEINKYLAEKKGIQFILKKQTNLPKIQCDHYKIEQVISNFLTNAVKFSNPKTTIILSVSSDPENIYISVEDQGKGILKEDFFKVFQDFGKTQTKPTGTETSTGLGLAIAKRIIDAHRGKISFTSSKDIGSTFSISLPIVAKKNP